MPEMHDKSKPPRSEEQKAASRRKGAKSRGPVTPEGKAKSAHNALRHGLTAFNLPLTCEDQASFDLVLADCMDEYQPADATENILVERTPSLNGRCVAPGLRKSSLSMSKLKPTVPGSTQSTRPLPKPCELPMPSNPHLSALVRYPISIAVWAGSIASVFCR